MSKKLDPVVKGLKAIKRLIGKPERWTKGSFALDRLGQGVSASSARAVCWCLHGAYDRIGYGIEGLYSALDRAAEIEARSRNASMISYNDDPRRTHAQVMRLLDRAIARREREIAR